jgi:serine/threonine-protein kinase HipA
MRRLGLPRRDIEQQVLRAFFNAVGRNCDDHVKNIAFLMDRHGQWSLAPAFDVSYALNPVGEWTSRHQMSINGKREAFEREDLLALAGAAGIKAPQANQMLDGVVASLRRWPEFAEAAGVPAQRTAEIQRQHLLGL